MSKKTLSKAENDLIYDDFNYAKRKMIVSKIAFNLAKQELDDFGRLLHDAKYWQAAAEIIYNSAKEKGFV